MRRVQIYIPEWQYRFLRQRARQTEQSVAGLIRNLVQREAETVQMSVADDPIWNIVGAGHGGPPHDVSERVDDFVYDGAEQ